MTKHYVISGERDLFVGSYVSGDCVGASIETTDHVDVLRDANSAAESTRLRQSVSLSAPHKVGA